VVEHELSRADARRESARHLRRRVSTRARTRFDALESVRLLRIRIDVRQVRVRRFVHEQVNIGRERRDRRWVVCVSENRDTPARAPLRTREYCAVQKHQALAALQLAHDAHRRFCALQMRDILHGIHLTRHRRLDNDEADTGHRVQDWRGGYRQYRVRKDVVPGSRRGLKNVTPCELMSVGGKRGVVARLWVSRKAELVDGVGRAKKGVCIREAIPYVRTGTKRAVDLERLLLRLAGVLLALRCATHRFFQPL
jgi:hypothetical protein